MSFISNIFGFKNKNKKIKEEINQVNLFLNEYFSLLNKEEYLARSDFNEIKKEYNDIYNKFKTLANLNSLDSFCEKNKTDISRINSFLYYYEDLLDLKQGFKRIKEHNDFFVKTYTKNNKEYFDKILEKIDSNIRLDDEQIKICLDNEDYSLIIAGAGSGKTTTLAAKVKYLIDRKNIDPKDILIIAFTNKAVNELKDKINKTLGYDVPISTFHSCGRAIAKKDVNYADTNILDDNFFFINKYLNTLIKKDSELLSQIIMLFAYYLDLTEDITKNISLEDHFTLIETNDFSTLKSNTIDINKIKSEALDKNKIYTIQNERLRSNEEVQIANFLFLNGIDYEYEKVYKFSLPNSNKKYTPDFYLKQGDLECYLEHFGITEDHKNNRYDKEQLDDYIIKMNNKINHHKIHNTKLIYTFSKYNDNKSLLSHLEEELIKMGFILNKRSDEEVFEIIEKNKENKYLYKFTRIASRFISLFKARDYNLNDFELLQRKTENPRNKLFLSVMEKVYIAYQLYLKENKLVDFDDMINESTHLLNEVKDVQNHINYKYIMIDEYQDISRSRLNLAKAIKNASNAKITVVGDDWQAIYGYAGSEINLFTNFVEQMGYASVLRISKTYRNAQELIDIAGNFIQKNNIQLRKNLISSKHIDKPINVYTYDGAYKSKDNPGESYNKAKLLERIIALLVKLNGPKQNILIIGRYNFDGNHLLETGLFEGVKTKTNNIVCKKYHDVKLNFMTAHSTKGLTYDNVILINAINGKYGFPSQIEDDPLFDYVRTEDKSYEFSEERRLFYVALTRTKNRVFILVPYQNPSSFILELLEDYKNNINLQDTEFPIKKEIKLVNNNRTKCPICGYPLQIQNNPVYGLRLFICTNEPEICDYMTNDLISGKKSIHICKDCGGIMYVKKRKDKNLFFFGCSNYKKDGSGCNNAENIDD